MYTSTVGKLSTDYASDASKHPLDKSANLLSESIFLEYTSVVRKHLYGVYFCCEHCIDSSALLLLYFHGLME